MSDAASMNEVQYGFDKQMTEAEPIPALSIIDDCKSLAPLLD